MSNWLPRDTGRACTSRADYPGLKTVPPFTSCVTLGSVQFLICKIGIKIGPCGFVMRIKYVKVFRTLPSK